MNDYIVSGPDRREIPVTKNIPWIIYVGSDTVYRHVKEFETRVRKQCLLAGGTSVFLSVGITFATMDKFKDFLGIPASVWYAFFLFVLLASAVVMIVSAIGAWKDRNKTTADFVVCQIAGIAQQSNDKSVKLSTF